jgi:hypothetical protein
MKFTAILATARLRVLSTLSLIVLLVVSCLSPVGRSLAFDQLELTLGTVAGADWRAERLHFTFDWEEPAKAGYRLEIGSLELPGLQPPLTDLKIDCLRGGVEADSILCEEGKIRLTHPLLESASMVMSFELDRVSGAFSGQLRDIGIAGGRLDLTLSYQAGEWRFQGTGRGLMIASLRRLWQPLNDHLTGWSTAGRIDLDGRVSGRDKSVLRASWKGRFRDLSLSDEGGFYIGEGVGVGFEGRLNRNTGLWQIDNRLTLNAGELLTPFVYLDAAAHPLCLEGKLLLDEGFETLALREVKLHREGLLDLELDGDLRLTGQRLLKRLKVRVEPFQSGEFYREMVQPTLAGTPWGRFEMAGEVDLSLDLQDERVSLELGLNEFNLDDVESDDEPMRLGLYGVTGRLYWSRGGERRGSHLDWRAGHLLEHIDIGPGRIDFEMADDRLMLSQLLRVPLLDGTLVVNRLHMEALGKPTQRLQFDGFIEPISMSSLSQALGWPPLSGKLSGMIPGVNYEQGLLSVDGVLLMRIFDGDILIRELKSRDLFDVYPQLSADIELRNLDLESLTRTFSFGRITGRMDGYVRELRLEDWAPVAFDSRFYTPEKDKSRHRISQRAVDNISNLGGAGLSGSLARSFLGFFKEFSYKRIGIGCRLQNGVCDMSGAGKAKQGYYLVEGSGIPRIDIIGYNATADWSRLVEQLKQINTQGGQLDSP